MLLFWSLCKTQEFIGVTHFLVLGAALGYFTRLQTLVWDSEVVMEQVGWATGQEGWERGNLQTITSVVLSRIPFVAFRVLQEVVS